MYYEDDVITKSCILCVCVCVFLASGYGWGTL
jgi:hypothetical protein